MMVNFLKKKKKMDALDPLTKSRTGPFKTSQTPVAKLKLEFILYTSSTIFKKIRFQSKFVFIWAFNVTNFTYQVSN